VIKIFTCVVSLMDSVPLQTITGFKFTFQDFIQQNADWNEIYDGKMASQLEMGSSYQRATKFRSQAKNVSGRLEFSLLIFGASSVVVGGSQNGHKSYDLDVS